MTENYDLDAGAFTTRDVPWAKFGVSVIDEARTAHEAMDLAGLDWKVELRKDGYQTAAGNWRVDQSKRKVVRVDTEQPLGTVSPGYEPLQYDEAFDFLDAIHPEFVAAGSMKQGRQAFIVVKAPEHDEIDALGEDHHDLYVVVRTSHDGTRALEVNILPLRNVCTNMMAVSPLGAKQRWSIRHTKSMREKLEQAKRTITGLNQYEVSYREMADRLATIELDLTEARDVIEKVVPDYLKTKDKKVDAILNVYQNSPVNGFTGTGWGLVNAVTEYHDWFHGGDNRQAETRWLQGLDGSTSRAANRTVQLLEHRWFKTA